MKRVVGVLRPEPGNAATCAALRAAGYEPRPLPLFTIEPVAWTAPDPAEFDTLLVSSANAFRHGGDALTGLRSLPVHAVGEATARAARAAGFSVAAVGAGGVDALAPPGRVLRLVGREHIARAGVARTIVVYASAPIAADVTPLNGGVALIHSARAGARLAALVTDRSRIAIAAISAAAAEATGPGWRTVVVAAQPSDATLIAALPPLFD